MAIKFRCPHCKQLLGISGSEAGQETVCPMCEASIQVPLEQERTGTVRRKRPAVSATAVTVPFERRVIADPPISESAAPASVPAVKKLSDLEVAAIESEMETGPPVPPVPVNLELLAAEIGSAKRKSELPQSKRRFSFPVGVLIPIVLASAFAGGVIGRGLLKPSASPSQPASSSEKPASLPQQKFETQWNVITGTVTFTDSAGAARPDRGARVLILPMVRKGSVKMPGSGFRVGADATDWDILVNTVRTLGGDCQLADAQGRFSLTIPTAGQYGLLVASRYQQRPIGENLGAGCRKFLETYFERPDQVIGNVQVEFREISVNDLPQSSRTIHFLRP